MADPYNLPPIPQPPTQDDLRMAVLKQDPAAMALILAGPPDLQKQGQFLMENQLARQTEGRQTVGERFTQGLQAGGEARLRQYGAAELGLKGRGLDIEQQKLALEQRRLEMGRWQPIVGADGITYLYDSLSHQIVNGVVPGAGWDPALGGGRPGAVIAPGVAPAGYPTRYQGPAAPPPSPAPGPSGGPQLGASHVPGVGMPPPAAAPAGGPPAAPGMPSGDPRMNLPPQAQQYMEMAARKHMPPDALKDLDEADKAELAIRQGLQAVTSRPQAFDPGQSAEEYAPFDFARNLGRAVHSRTRDPEDTKARAAVFAYTVGAMHDYFGARMTEPEFQRSGLFLPSLQESAPNIQVKLQQALAALQAHKARLRATYMPMLPPGAGPAAGPAPAPAAAGAPSAPGVRRFTRDANGRLVEVK